MTNTYKLFKDEGLIRVEMGEPDHLNYKYQNQFNEWVFKSSHSKNQYGDDYDKWINRLSYPVDKNSVWQKEEGLREGVDFYLETDYRRRLDGSHIAVETAIPIPKEENKKTKDMKKDIKDYLHLYLGCDAIVKMKGVEYDHKIQLWGYNYYANENEFEWVKPILRPLSDMTNEEAEHFAWLCLNSRHAPKDFIAIDKDEIQTDIHKNDGGNMLDDDVEIYIEVSCRCMDGYVSIMKDGRIGMSDEIDTPSENMKPVDSVEEKILYLLSKHFDLFGLIGKNLAIDKTKLNSDKNDEPSVATEV